jgi:hypothetical protein
MGMRGEKWPKDGRTSGTRGFDEESEHGLEDSLVQFPLNVCSALPLRHECHGKCTGTVHRGVLL